MASRRKLKRNFIALSASLFDEALLIRAFATEDQVAKIEEIMDDIMIFTDDTIRRIQHPDGADNPKLVRAYYRQLRADMDSKLNAFDDRLTSELEAL